VADHFLFCCLFGDGDHDLFKTRHLPNLFVTLFELNAHAIVTEEQVLWHNV
jgi:hypothetical protein